MSTTPSDITQFKEMIVQEWTDSATVASWRASHPRFFTQLHQATQIVVEAARVRPGMQVLDLACGTGEPALTLAEAVGPQGHVTATDLGPGMLATCEENARAQGLTNMSFQVADAHALPFPDQTFDRVTCRFGVIYFADCGQAMREIHRVLKPGGRVALAAWAPLDQNQFMMIPLMPFVTRVAVPPPPPGAPHPFKYAEAGSLSAELAATGFGHIEESFRALTLPFPSTPEEQWDQFYGGAAPFHPIIDSLSPEERTAAINEALAGYRACYDGARVTTSATIVLASAVR